MARVWALKELNRRTGADGQRGLLLKMRGSDERKEKSLKRKGMEKSKILDGGKGVKQSIINVRLRIKIVHKFL